MELSYFFKGKMAKKRSSKERKSRPGEISFPQREITRLINQDKRYLWHPFTQMQEWTKETPIIIKEAKGVYLKDLRGHSYLDGTSSIWVNLHGHQCQEIDEAIKSQLKKVAHSTLLGLSNIPAIRLAKALVRIAPKGLTRVFYSDDGSTAMEIAIKMAYQFWQLQKPAQPEKKIFVSFTNAYHGDTVGSVSVGGIDLFHQRFASLLFKTLKIPSPYCYRCHLDLNFPSCQLACADEIEKTLRSHHPEIAAVVIEPKVQAAAGLITAPPGFLKRIRQICTDLNILLIADEVATGFGRTGTMFACQEDGVTPDILALSKGITGGYLPLAATLTTDPVYKTFLGSYEEFKTFFHGHSYTGNPLGCAAALANLQIFKKGKVLTRLKGKATFLRKILAALKDLPHVGDIRQAGFMVGIELVRKKKTKNPYPLTEKIGIRVCEEAKKRGMILRPLGNIIVLVPPFISTRKELARMVEIIREAITQITDKKVGNQRE